MPRVNVNGALTDGVDRAHEAVGARTKPLWQYVCVRALRWLQNAFCYGKLRDAYKRSLRVKSGIC